MSIDLTHDLQRALDDEARRQGTTPDLLAMQFIRERLFGVDDTGGSADEPRNLVDFLDGYIGVLDSGEHVPGGANMSERTGDQFTAGLLERRAQGRL
jgi:hypothetical protein